MSNEIKPMIRVNRGYLRNGKAEEMSNFYDLFETQEETFAVMQEQGNFYRIPDLCSDGVEYFSYTLPDDLENVYVYRVEYPIENDTLYQDLIKALKADNAVLTHFGDVTIAINVEGVGYQVDWYVDSYGRDVTAVHIYNASGEYQDTKRYEGKRIFEDLYDYIVIGKGIE